MLASPVSSNPSVSGAASGRATQRVEIIRQCIEKSWYIDASQPVFAGHFPAHPILPGVLILGLLKRTLAEHFDTPLRIATIRRQRFIKPVLPQQTLRVQVTSLDIHADEMDIVYLASVEGQVVAKGSVLLRVDHSQILQDGGVV